MNTQTIFDINRLASLLARRNRSDFDIKYREPAEGEPEEYHSIVAKDDGKEYVLADGVNSNDARLITETLTLLPTLLEIAASTFERAKCEVCGELAQWEYAPCGSVGEYCDEHVPRGCSCNAIDFEDPNSSEYRDEQGRLLPCIEYDFFALGFEPGDRAEAAAYREKYMVPKPVRGS